MVTAIGVRGSSTFDVICAGEALWDVGSGRAALRFRPGGGAVNAAFAIAQRGLRVGLAAAIEDDTFGRALVSEIAAAGVTLPERGFAKPRAGLVVAVGAGAALRIVDARPEDLLPVAVPEEWAARVLLVSGLSPAVAHAAELCRSARAARRAGTIVVVDLNARWRLWAGCDPRAIRAVVGEADVVRCSSRDLSVLGITEAAVRTPMRASAVLVVTDGAAAAFAKGPFGEVGRPPAHVAPSHVSGAGDAFTAVICADLARRGDPQSDRADVWDRAIERAHEAAGEVCTRRASGRRA